MNKSDVRIIYNVFRDVIKSEHDHHQELGLETGKFEVVLTIADDYSVQCKVVKIEGEEILADVNLSREEIRSDFEFVEWIKSTDFSDKVHDVCNV
ncbi:UNVERIFIED_CONTAM: hypothetical protein RF648_18935, partial [Kocuria sp. CPCC 205274]